MWKDGRPALTRLDIELTERCNFACAHCSINLPAGDAGARKRELDTQAIKAILEEASSLGCLAVRFTGGEPLLRDDFAKIYTGARKLGLRVMIFTNASLLTAGMADLLAKYPPLEKIEVSIYGMSPESCQAVTGAAGGFAASMKGIELLLDRGLPFVVKGAVLPGNKKELGKFDDWASSLPWMQGRKPALAMAFELRTRRDSGEKSAGIMKVRPDPQEIVGYELGRDPDLREFRSFVAGRHELYGDLLFNCYPTGAAAVDSYGNLQYCLSLRHPDTVYDLKKGSLREAVSEFLPEVGCLRAKNADYLKRCGSCFLKEACLQCPSRSWSEHGTLDTPVDYLCRITHLKAEAAGLLKPGEKAWLPEARSRFLKYIGKDSGRPGAACPEQGKE